jgi:hypothetical protein
MADRSHPAAAIDLERAVFRSNSRYDLVLFDRLPAAQQEMLADLKNRPDLYGILRPAEDSGMSVKSVNRETALLYLTLRDPGPLPAYARALAAADDGAGIARLVLDQILEIGHEDRFVSGREAYDVLYGDAVIPATDNRLQQLSIEALRYGEALALTDVGELSMRLYNFHRLPLTSRWREKYSGPERVAEQLGAGPGGRYSDFLASHWQPVTDRDGESSNEERAVGWLSWARRRPPEEPAAAGMTYKLYVSPMPAFVENVFAITVKTLTTTGAVQFKIGADADGLLRPDKIVAYFTSQEALKQAADALAPRLHGCPAQGVPFSAALDDDGLLSWGVDPPASQQLLNWQPRESWRLWLTNRLANALLTAKRTPATGSAVRRRPWQYALERVRLEGVDTSTWTPAEDLWRQPATV